MLFIALFSVTLGFLLNEEACLNRICRNLGYAHEGWLLIKCEYSVLLLAGACAVAFLKGYGVVRLLGPYFAGAWAVPAGLFFFGNVLAARRVQGLFYTPWIALMGIMCAGKPAVFQGVMTVLAVCWLVTREVRIGIKLWLPTMLVLTLLFFNIPQGLF